MVQQKKLNEIPAVRWSVLAIVSFTMLGGYIIPDVVAPLKPVLKENSAGQVQNMDFFPAHSVGSTSFS